jgi:hypothetical protein
VHPEDSASPSRGHGDGLGLGPSAHPPSALPSAPRASTPGSAGATVGAAGVPDESLRADEPLDQACYRQFVPSLVPRVDATRLALACGPSGGLAPFARASGVVDETAAPFVYGWDADRRDCFRVFAVAAPSVADLEIEVTGPEGFRSLTSASVRWAVVDEARPFCSKHGGHYDARFVTHGGHGAVYAAIWRGARMIPAP